jgi:predicted DNA-binding transcriptional regulator AlpA
MLLEVCSAVPEGMTMVAKKKQNAQVAASLKAARLKAKSKEKPSRPRQDKPAPEVKSPAPASPISAVPQQPRAPPVRRFHFEARADQIAAAPGSDDELLTGNQMAAWFGVSIQTIDIARHRGDGPPYQRLGPRLIRYHRGSVRQWLFTRTHRSTAEYSR